MVKLPLLLTTFLTRLLGRKVQPTPMQPPATPVPPAPTQWPRPQTEAEQARDAIATIDLREYAHIRGVSRPSFQQELTAWTTLEATNIAVAGYVRASLAAQQTLPACPRNGDVDVWWSQTQTGANESTPNVVGAILQGVSLKAWPDLEDVMAREVENTVGTNSTITHLNGPAAKRETHITDSHGRIIVARLFELGHDGPLVLAGYAGGRISRITIERSEWQVRPGWATGGRAPRAKPAHPAGGGSNGGGDDHAHDHAPAAPRVEVAKQGK
jgi:hypothetical protein